MSDEKNRPAFGGTGTPDKGDGIPAPITSNSSARSGQRSRVFRFIAIFLVLASAHFLFNGFWEGRKGAGSLSSSEISIQHHHHHHHHHHGRHPLVGKRAEKYFLEVPNEESCIQASRHYTAKPHPAGSDADLQTAKDFLTLLQEELGVKAPSEPPIFSAGSRESRHATLAITRSHAPYAWIDTYYPVMNTPLDRNLQALDDEGNVIWEADLQERADDRDPEAGKYSDAVPTFHGLSCGGDVKGKLIYANYGSIEDYDKLVEKGVNFTGAIVLTRYGANFRGLKIKRAEELGAAGVLIYSDLRDDGYVTEENGYKAYPDGPARNPKSVQRGSVQYLSLYPGDPTTPGYPAYENSTRTEGANIPKIPSLPISSENAAKLLELVKGDWNGTVRLNNQVDDRVMPIWNTMAVIPGYIKDEIVMVGNHRDAWVMGATDPTSGTASLHETIRGFGQLLRKGWKPLRTILIASWDAEEYGLIGSTEWGEDFSEFIDKYLVAYLNLDSSVSGSRFSAQASPSLAHVVQQAAVDVPHPTKENLSLWDASKDSGSYFGAREDGVSVLDAEAHDVFTAQMNALDELGVGVLGSGSDYTIFLQRIGVASMNNGFGRTSSDAAYHYHSVYDSERWMETYADPGFYRHVAIAKYLGLLTMRIANPIVLPINTTHYAYELENYLDKVEALVSPQSAEVDLSALRSSIRSLQAASLALDYEKLVAERELVKILKRWKKKAQHLKKLRKKARKAWCKIQKKVFGKKCKKPHEDRHLVDSEYEAIVSTPRLASGAKPRVGRLPAWAREQKETNEGEMLRGLAIHTGVNLDVQTVEEYITDRGCVRDLPNPIGEFRAAVHRIRAVNQKLVAFERGFISEDGIPEREWYKHLAVAPGKWLGYGATTLPALTESITIEKNSTLAQYEAERLKTLVEKLVDKIRV